MKVKKWLLGVGWNKEQDTYAVEVDANEMQVVTRRMMSKVLASIYDSHTRYNFPHSH